MDDDGKLPNRRRMGGKEWLQLASLALMIAAILWRGGQLNERIENMSQNIAEVKSIVAYWEKESAKDRAALEVLTERQRAQGERINNHESRINRIEQRSR